MTRTLAIIALLIATGASAGTLSAAETPAAAPAAVDAALQKRVDAKAAKLVDALRLEDAAKATRAKAILGAWCITLANWHSAHDAELNDLWKQWSAARAVVPKDEFPGEVVATKIDAVYAGLKPEYQAFLEKLSAELTPEQVDAIKEAWSRSPGMARTYNAYLEIAPDLTEEQKKVIHDRMLRAREDAMLTDADKEIVNIYKRHKVKVEQYIGALQWTKLHKAYADRAKAPATAPAAN